MNADDAMSRPDWMPDLRLPPLAQIALILLLVLALVWWIKPTDAPLTQLQLRGEFQHLSADDVRQAAAPFLSASFFTADVQAVRDAVQALPWVSRVRVDRLWPGALTIHVWEREPYARWNESAMLDTESQPFSPRAADIPTGLPQLGGTRGSEAEVAQGWQRVALPLVQTALQLSGLSVDARGEWSALTASGIELRLGQGQPERHVATLTGAAIKKLDGRWSEVKYLDLRYTNGFAVGWANRGLGEGPVIEPRSGERPDSRRAMDGAAGTTPQGRSAARSSQHGVGQQ